MAVSPSYQSFIFEQLYPHLPVRAQAMFGAVPIHILEDEEQLQVWVERARN